MVSLEAGGHYLHKGIIPSKSTQVRCLTTHPTCVSEPVLQYAVISESKMTTRINSCYMILQEQR